MKLDLTFTKFILKPLVASLIMGICSYGVYLLSNMIHPGRIAAIISILFAVIIYFIVVVILKIFTKEEILMIPMGNKIYNFLLKLKLYKEA